MAISLEGITAPLFHVFDVPTAIAFYRDILGFEVVHHSAPFTAAPDDYGWALLRHGTAELMLNNAYEDNIRPPAPDPARTAAHQDTTLYFSSRDLDAAFSYLRAQGVPLEEPQTTYYGMRQLLFTDPDGYSLCLQCPSE